MLASPSGTPAAAHDVRTVRMGGDALPRWWKFSAHLLLIAASLFVLYETALRTSLAWETHRGMSAREALLGAAESYGAPLALLPALLLAGTVVLVIRLPRGRARREVAVDAEGLEVIKHRNWWFPGRRGRIPWSRIQTVSAWRASFLEHPGRGSRRIMRPVLDLYLHRGPVDLPDWVSCTTVTRTPLEGVAVPAVRVRIGGPGTSMERSLRELAGTLGRVRPEIFYRGTDAEQWFTPVRNRRLAAPLAEGDDKDTLPMERPGLPRPVWLCFTMPFTRWAAGAAGFAAALVLAGYGMFTPHWQPWSTALSASAVPVLVPVLASWVVFAPRKLAKQGMGIDAEGLYLLQESMWWFRSRVWFGASWDQVLAAVARVVPAAETMGRSGTAHVVDLYLSGPVPADLGGRVRVTRHEHPDGPGMGDLVAFPATRLRMYYSPVRERRGLRWSRGWRSRAAVRKLPAHQLRPVLRVFQPDVCHGFDDVGPLPDPPRRRTPHRG